LVSVNRVAALLGGTDAVQSEHLARGAESAGVPVIVQAAFPARVLNENAFCCAPSLSRRGEVIGRFVSQNGLKADNVVLLVDERDRAALAVADAIRNSSSNVQVTRFGFQKLEEIADLLARAAKAKPKAIVFACSGRDLRRLRVEQEKLSLHVPVVFAGEDVALPSLIAERDIGEGVYAVTSFSASNPVSAKSEFFKKYQGQFHEPPDVSAALSYDSARILTEALRTANTTSAGALREALAGLHGFESVTGPLSFGEDHFARRPLFAVQITQGQATLMRHYGADE
jgi:ABC-type branched-subunit amino acid transport system substrate-binding protein